MFKLEIKGHKKTRLNDKGGIKGFKVIKAVLKQVKAKYVPKKIKLHQSPKGVLGDKKIILGVQCQSDKIGI